MNRLQNWDALTGSLDFSTLREYYSQGGTPEYLIHAIFDRIDARGEDPAWISVRPREKVLEDAALLRRSQMSVSSLWGIPFGIKDNLDLTG